MERSGTWRKAGVAAESGSTSGSILKGCVCVWITPCLGATRPSNKTRDSKEEMLILYADPARERGFGIACEGVSDKERNPLQRNVISISVFC